MMMYPSKKPVFTLILLTIGISSIAQQKLLTLDEALQSAEKNYPSLKQKPLLQGISEQNQKLLNASLFPHVSATGQATYQSEVTSFEMPGASGSVGQNPDNYFVGLEMRLPITEFGTVKTRKQLEIAETKLGMARIDVELQALRERVTGLFGNALLQSENLEILSLRLNNLDSQLKKLAVAVANGAVLKSNQLVLESEILATQQRIDDIRSTLKGLTGELAVITGLPLDSATKLQMSNIADDIKDSRRPENLIFEAQRNVLDLQSTLLNKESKPDIYFFGQGLYGRPGYNFLNPDMRPYGIAGIGLNWDLNNLLNKSRQQKILDINCHIINSQEETFNQNLQAALKEKSAEIEKYHNIISKDAQIVSNRQQILKASASQLENGVITSTEYLLELNAQNSAELNLTLHQVQLNLARAQYNTLLGY